MFEPSIELQPSVAINKRANFFSFSVGEKRRHISTVGLTPNIENVPGKNNSRKRIFDCDQEYALKCQSFL